MLCIRAAYAIMRCLSACVSVTFVHSVNHTILVFPYQTAWQYSDGNPPNGDVKCRWGKQQSRFWANIWLYCLLLTLQQEGVVNMVAGGSRPPYHKLWHIAGSKRRCWLRERMTKCLWQEVSTLGLRQRQQNSTFNCTQWQICSLRN